MQIQQFLNALKQVAASPLAYVAYVILTLAWAAILWRTSRLKVIAKQLALLPEKDRLSALEGPEARLMPRSGLDAERYLRFVRQRYIFLGFGLLVIAVVLLLSLSIYRAIEASRNTAVQSALRLGLKAAKVGKLEADENELRSAAATLSSAVEASPTYEGFISLGNVYDDLTEIDKSIASFEKALALKPQSVEALIALGRMYADKGDLDKSQKYLEFAQPLVGDDKEQKCMVLGNLGIVLYERARLPQNKANTNLIAQLAHRAINEFYAPALELKGFVKNQDFVAKLYANAGNAAAEMSDFEQARSYLNQAIRMKRKLAANISLAETLNNLGNLLLKEKKFALARPFFEEAAGIFEIVGNKKGQGVIEYNLADIAWSNDDLPEARRHYQKSMDLLKDAGAGTYVVHVERRIAQLDKGEKPDGLIIGK